MVVISKIRNAISSSAPVNFIRRKSKQIILPGFRGIPLYDVVLFFWEQVKTTGITERASAVAFNLVMAIPPTIIFLFTLIPFLPISRQFEYELYELIRDVVPGEKDNAVLIKFLQDFINNPRNGLLSLGFILSAFFSSNAMMGIMRTFDQNYIGFRKRSEFRTRVVALKLTFIILVLFSAFIILLIAQGAVLKWVGIKSVALRIFIDNFRWVIIIFLFFMSISYIYRHAPAVHKKWRMINPGSIVATFLMLLFTLLFSWYVANFGNYNKLYGSIGTILFIMLLIYFNSLVLLIGFELNVSITSLKKIADERNNNPAAGNGSPA